MRFAKGHGTENDFVILLDPDGRDGLSQELAARLCDRRAGIGGDGVLRAVRTAAMVEAAEPGIGASVMQLCPDDRAAGDGAAAQPCPEWFMDYRNANGSVAEMCGNGIRVFARYLVEHGLAKGPEFTVATRSGPRRVLLGDGGGLVTVEMGGVTVLGPGHAVVGGQACAGLRVSVGNPHLACLVDAPLDSFDLSRPPTLDPAQFPGGGNVELVLLTGARSVAMRVHERGSGETRSCGTGAVAAAAAAASVTGADDAAPAPWTVTVPGGELTVTLDSGCARLTGPAVIVAEGELDPTWQELS